ncbi:Sec34-domain-containing protein [Stipitochalara longipes BDJ]|nr:Sec34-domain-containing protein [Stipitochalara longipes BDJ]
MYEDSWYSYVPDSHKKEDVSAHGTKHRRKESLLKQTNGGSQTPDPSDPIMELFEETSGLKSPPQATLARRAKSYSDFYEVAIDYLKKETKHSKPKDILEIFDSKTDKVPFGLKFEDLEDDLLDASQEEYQLYRDQLALSERHLGSLLSDTASALDLLASLSESFKTVESETTAFQAQCEDLLDEQKRLRDLADEVGTDLQYYAYLEPLTRRLNAPGAGRIVRSDDFLDMLRNLNTCIDFMEEHPNYRDSTIYKTRYTTLLERALNLVQMDFSSALKEVSDDVGKQLRAKEHNETAEYVLLYGKFEQILDDRGPQLKRLLQTQEFAFGHEKDKRDRHSYFEQYHSLYSQIAQIYLKSRDQVGPVVLKNLRKFAGTDSIPEVDFETLGRRSVQYVLDTCHNEQSLMTRFFNSGPLLLEYPSMIPLNKAAKYAERLEENVLSHLANLNTFLAPHLGHADLPRICKLVDWLETTYMPSNDEDSDADQPEDDRRWIAQVLLSKYLWPTLDSLFIKAAGEIEHFKPSQEDLRFTTKYIPLAGERKKSSNAQSAAEKSEDPDTPTPTVLNAYPTVQTAVKLLVMYNEGSYDRPRNGDVLYDIVHQTTESLQKAATVIKRNSVIMDAQLFLIKNLMLIENLFMTHEIPDSVRQSAEFDFTPIWETIQELQNRKQLFNPLAYIRPLVKGELLPAVVDRVLDARKELEKVLVQQITAFTKTWQARLAEKDYKKREVIGKDLNAMLNKVFDDETTRAALWKMIRAEE